MRIAIGNDHGGLELADACRDWLEDNGFSVIDCGTNNSDSVDYPVYAKKVVEEIIKIFLNTEFEGGRHKDRINKIELDIPGARVIGKVE